MDVDPSSVADGGPRDRIEFQPGTAPADVLVTRDAWSLHLTIGDTGDSVTVSSWFEHERFQVEEVGFADGTVWGRSQLEGAVHVAAGGGRHPVGGTPGGDRLDGGSESDEIYGHAGADEIFGGAGDDTLHGGEGADLLAGGPGADRVVGGGGGDTYLFGRGDGCDRLEEGPDATEVDILRLGSGVTPEEVEASREDASLLLTLVGGSDRILVSDFFRTDGSGVERIEFEDGTVWSAATLPRVRCDGTDFDDVLRGGDGDEHLRGFLGDDALLGGGGADVLDGGPGNDVLDGGTDSDRYVFGRGYGEDRLPAWQGDSIEMLPGVGAVGVAVRTTHGVRDHRWSWGLEIEVTETGDRLTLDDWDPAKEVVVRFSDGTVWDAETLTAQALTAATEGPDALRGTSGGDEIRGLGGNDWIDAGAGDDVLDGGSGADTLRGGTGSDVYLFGRGGGHDQILDQESVPGSLDTIRFGEGVGPQDVAVRWVHGGSPGFGDLVLEIGDTGDRVRVTGWFSHAGCQVERVEFADGTAWTVEDVAALARVHPTPGADHLGGTPAGEALRGEEGDDVLRGYGGSDELRGGEGADVLYGGDGDDVLDGGPGDDCLYGDFTSEVWDHGSYALNPESGSDTYVFGRGYGRDTIFERDHTEFSNPSLYGYPRATGARVDTVRLLADVEPDDVSVHLGGSGALSHLAIVDTDDRLFGLSHVERLEFSDGTVWTRTDLFEKATKEFAPTSGADVLFGTDGPDRIDGLAGDDSLHGGEGADALYGGDGADRLAGWNGDDGLYGGSGPDVLEGGRGADLLRGGPGDDVLMGDDWGGFQGNDGLYGDTGDDVLYGRGGFDLLDGGPGNDRLVGDDTVLGPFGHYERGGDTYVFAPGYGWDTIHDADVTSGEDDVLKLAGGLAPADVRVTRDPENLHLEFGETGDRVTVEGWFLEDGVDHRIERVEFEDGTVWTADRVEALLSPFPTEGTDVLHGTAGPDLLSGFGGDDYLFGGGGDDRLEGGTGADRLEGQAGSDILDGGGGEDRLLGGDGEDDLVGGDGNDVVEGGPGADLLAGGEGSDVLEGGDGADVLSGGPGNDVLRGGPDGDVYVFGRGDGWDTAHPDAAQGAVGDRVRLAGSVAPEDVRVLWGGGKDLHLSIVGTEDRLTLSRWFEGAQFQVGLVEFEDGTSWNGAALEALLAQATEGADFLRGSDGDDLLAGLEGDDTLAGGGGADELLGGPGRDVLDGGGGADVLDGGPGDDRLAGGVGDDTYRFGPGAGADRVYDCGFDSWGEVPGGSDAVVVAPGVGPGDVVASRSTGDLVLTIVSSGDSLTLARWFEGPTWKIETVAFADGTTWDVPALEALCSRPGAGADYLVGGEGDDRLAGLEGDDRLFGGAGRDSLEGGPGKDQLHGEVGEDRLEGGEDDDSLYGGPGNDELDGGPGNDRLVGHSGSDVYWFGAGDGQDVVYDWDFTRDVVDVDCVRFRGDLAPGGVSASRDAENLYLEIRETGDRLTVQGWFSDVRTRIERVEFADGTVWGVAELQDLVLPRPTGGDDRLYGTPYRDFVEAGDGADVVHGLGGNDELFGEGGNDLLVGGDGDDTLAGGPGDDRIQGGEGRDVLDGGAGSDRLEGGGGGDVYRFGRASGVDEISEGRQGTEGEDSVRFESGVSPGDVVVVRVADDLRLVIPGTGDQLSVCRWFDGPEWQIERVEFEDGTAWGRADLEGFATGATPGDDVLNGTDGADRIRGGDGDDRLLGGGGDDILQGDGGQDSLRGDAGNDELLGGDGYDSLDGGDGDDVLRGEGEGGSLSGGPGSDLLDPGTGSWSRMQGGTGNDTYLFGRGAGEVLIFEQDTTPGNLDVIRVAQEFSPADLSLGRDESDLFLGLGDTGDLLIVSGWFMKLEYQVERVEFADGTAWEVPDLLRLAVQHPTDAGDTLGGSPYDDVVEGLDGNDTLQGWGGDDRLDGGGGQDRIFGDEGDDRLLGGSGDDHLIGGTGDDYLDGGPGDDRLAGTYGSDTYRFGRGGGHDTVEQSRRPGVDVDTVAVDDGIAPAEVRITRVVDDLVLSLSTGETSLAFEQWFRRDDNRVDRVEFADGTVWDPEAIEAMLPPEPTDGSDRLVGGSGADVLDGLEGDDFLYGGDGDDTLVGGAGADRLWGEAGDDVLSGGDGDDQLDGGPGSDVLDGGPVADRLRGGPGDDVYVFAPGSHWDTASEVDGGGLDSVRVTGYGTDDLVVVRDRDWLTLRVRGSTLEAMALEGWFGDEALRIERVEFPDGSVWDAAELERRARLPTEFDDYIVGTGAGDFLAGGPGNDLLFGQGGADVLHGGPDQDHLYGGAGGDVYLFGLDAGDDRVYEDDPDTSAVDVIRLGDGVGPGQVKVGWHWGDLEVRILGTDCILSVRDWFDGERYRVETIEFEDGTVWDEAAIRALVATPTQLADVLPGGGGDDVLQGLGGDDEVYGFEGDDTLVGGEGDDQLDGDLGSDLLLGGQGDDQLLGRAGADTLEGGAGDDELRGGRGSDCYRFGPGSGQDAVVEGEKDWFDRDALVLEGWSAGEVFAVRRNDALHLASVACSDSVEIQWWYAGARYQIEEVRLDGGTIWGPSDLESLAAGGSARRTTGAGTATRCGAPRTGRRSSGSTGTMCCTGR